MKGYELGAKFTPLTVQRIRDEFIDDRDGIMMPIAYVCVQTDAPYLKVLRCSGGNLVYLLPAADEDGYGDPGFWMDLDTMDTFLPDGDLRVQLHQEDEGRNVRGWLGSHWREYGPYQPGETKPWYFLTGKFTGAHNDCDAAQISADPLNTLSMDPLDCMTMFALQAKK